MRGLCLKASLVVAAFLLLAACCSASVVVVSESNPGGWSWTTNKGTCFMDNAGPCVDEGVGFAMGSGAFYGACTYNSGTGTATTSTNWLGTDTHAGQPLAGVRLDKILELSYSTYVSKQWTMQGGAGEEKYPRMPFQLQITFYDAAGNRRQIWHRPWALGTDPRGSNYSSAHLGMWENWDAINSGMWYECSTASTTFFFGTWLDVINQWPDATLVPTSTATNDWTIAPPTDPLAWISAGWDKKTEPTGNPTCTATGKPVNFVVGARKGSTTVYGSTTPAWYTESIGFKGYVDAFTMAVDSNSNGSVDPSEEVTYDFETDRAAARIVALNNANAYAQPGNPKHLFRFKIFGKVLSSADGYIGTMPIPDPTPNEFWISDGSTKDDGTGVKIPAAWQVICPGNTVEPGQFVSAVGRTEARFYFKSNPSAFWTNLADVNTLVAP